MPMLSEANMLYAAKVCRVACGVPALSEAQWPDGWHLGAWCMGYHGWMVSHVSGRFNTGDAFERHSTDVALRWAS